MSAVAEPIAQPRAGRRRLHWSVRLLGWFWLALIVVVGGVGVALQVMGPSGSGSVGPTETSVTPPTLPPAGSPVVAIASGAIPPPDPALEEPAPLYPGLMLPRVGADRRSPMQAYAAAAIPAEKRPRISILLAGVGMNATDSDAAARNLPPAISFAISPYSYRPAALLDTARARGHELFVSIPMEPLGYPLAEAGGQALMLGASDAVIHQRLEWALSRFAGYVGATAALAPDLRGEKFEAEPAAMAPVLNELAMRGLMFVDTRIGYGKPAAAVGRGIDIVLDDPAAVRGDIEAKLTQLEQIAHDRGSAVGLASAPRPTTVATLAAWAATLDARGLALMPVSAVAPLVPPK